MLTSSGYRLDRRGTGRSGSEKKWLQEQLISKTKESGLGEAALAAGCGAAFTGPPRIPGLARWYAGRAASGWRGGSGHAASRRTSFTPPAWRCQRSRSKFVPRGHVESAITTRPTTLRRATLSADHARSHGPRTSRHDPALYTRDPERSGVLRRHSRDVGSEGDLSIAEHIVEIKLEDFDPAKLEDRYRTVLVSMLKERALRCRLVQNVRRLRRGP